MAPVGRFDLAPLSDSRNLERDGLVTRTVTPTVPLTVEYDLTPLGRSLVGVFLQLKTWADLNMDDVAHARDRYDSLTRLTPASPRPGDSAHRPVINYPRDEPPSTA